MKTRLVFVNSLALATLLLPAWAQTPTTTHDNLNPAQPAPKRTTKRGTPNKQTLAPAASKAMGRKFVEKSKPAEILRTPIR